MLLCFSGGRFRYTSLFFPFLRMSEPRDADEILEHVEKSMSALATRPTAMHPAIWTAAQSLMLEVAMRTLNMGALLELVLGGAVAGSALWLVDAPGGLVAVGGLYPRLRQVRSSAMVALRRCGGAIAVAPLQLKGAAPQWRRLVEGFGQQVALHGTAWFFFQFDWVVAVVVNAVLGAELLQRAAREAAPQALEASRAGVLAWDGCCVAAGTWGLARQLRLAGHASRTPPKLASWVAETTPPSWKRVWREALAALDGLLLLA